MINLLAWMCLQPVSSDVRWYYMLELGFYFSLSVTLMFDIKRKDFLAHVTHHAITIGLLIGSWVMGGTRAGSLILLIHDSADVFLEVWQRALHIDVISHPEC